LLLTVYCYFPVILPVHVKKFRRGQGAPVFVEGGRLCHGTMASPSLVNDIHARRGNAYLPRSLFAHLCKKVHTKLMLTQNCSITWQSSRTELHFRHRVPYSS